MKLSRQTTTEDKPFTYFFKHSRRLVNTLTPDLITFQFDDEITARSFFDLLKDRLPLLNAAFPKIDELNVQLTKAQCLFFVRLVMYEGGIINTSFLEDSLLKTLRADEFDFSYQFILGIIPGDNDTRRLHNLRPKERGAYSVTPYGKVSSRLQKEKMYTPKEKNLHSQVQSNTLLDPQALSCAFGFGQTTRKNKLYGIITHTEDALFNRLLTNDYGTVSRPFEYNSCDEAIRFMSSSQDTYFSSKQIKQFKIANVQARKINSRTNEVLARVRFNPERSIVCICADSLEARLLAYDFAQELLYHYKIYAEKKSYNVNPKFRVPIIFYISNQKNKSKYRHDLQYYDDDMRKADVTEAIKIYKNNRKRLQYYKENNFEFLLGLPNITSQILLDESLGKPLAYIMMQNGYTRMLMRLLRPKSSDKPSLRDEVFEGLIKQSPPLFRQNDPVIAELILAEQFDLANKLITTTRSDKNNIKIYREGEEALRNYLLRKGNPRQIEFFGLEETIIEAAEKGYWVTVRLCIKEFPNINEKTLTKLYELDRTSNKLLGKKEHLSQEEIVNSQFNYAVSQKNSDRILRLIQLSPDHSFDAITIESALIDAMEGNNGDAIALVNFLLPIVYRNKKNKTDRISLKRDLLLITINKNLTEFIPIIIEYENNLNAPLSQTRNLIALELAHEIGNSRTISLLEEYQYLKGKLDINTIKLLIWGLIIDAFNNNNPKLAEERILRLCQKYQLLPPDNHNILDAIKTIMDQYNLVPNVLFQSFYDNGIGYLTSLFLAKKESHHISTMLNIAHHSNGSLPIFITDGVLNTVFDALLENISHQNAEYIHDMVEKFILNITESKIKTHTRYQWKQRILGHLQIALSGKNPNEEKAVLIFNKGFRFGETFYPHNFKLLIKENIIFFLKHMISVSTVTEKDMHEIINHIIENPSLIMTFQNEIRNRVKPCHIRHFIHFHPDCDYNTLLLLLDLIDKDQFCNEQNIWDFYSAFKFILTDSKIILEDKFITLSKPTLIRHMMLILLLNTLYNSINNLEDELNKPQDSCRWPNLALIVKTKLNQEKSVCTTNDPDRLRTCHAEVLDHLEKYFSDPDTVPDAETKNSTYYDILKIFENFNRSDNHNGAFFTPAHLEHSEFDQKMVDCMRRLDQKLNALKSQLSETHTITKNQLNPTDILSNTDENISCNR